MSANDIPRHPLYDPRMQNIHGPVPPKPEASDGDYTTNLFSPKRPFMHESTQNPFKRMKTSEGMHHVVHYGFNRNLTDDSSVRYIEFAKKYNEDEEILQSENIVPQDDVLSNDEPLPIRSFKRVNSRSQIALTRDLTPQLETTSLQPHASHIRENRSGASSREHAQSHAFRHRRPINSIHHEPTHHRQILPAPNTPEELVDYMTRHDGELSLRPVEDRLFFALKRIICVATAGQKERVGTDGMVGRNCVFVLTQEEIEEIQEYVRAVSGYESMQPKTMIRLICRTSRGDSLDNHKHEWPKGAMVRLNGKFLMTAMETPLCISAERLKPINQIKIKAFPQTVPEGFSVFLEVFSMLSFDEVKTLLIMSSPPMDEAIQRLKEACFGDKHQAKITLMCGDHPMRFPVYGKGCAHVECVDLGCFLEKVSVRSDFEWRCPICHLSCIDGIELNRAVEGVLDLHKSKPKAYFQITEEGEICDDSESDEDTSDEESVGEIEVAE